MSSKHFSSKSANVKWVQKRKPLARAIALALMVAVPAGAWAISIDGFKFLDKDSDSKFNNSDETLKENGYVFLKGIKPALSRVAVKTTDGKFTLYAATGQYKVWQYVDPTWLNSQKEQAGNNSIPDILWSSETTALVLDIKQDNTYEVTTPTGEKLTSPNFPMPDFSKQQAAVDQAKSDAEKACAADKIEVVFCGQGSSNDCATSNSSKTVVSTDANGVLPGDALQKYSDKVVGVYGTVILPDAPNFALTVGSLCNFGGTLTASLNRNPLEIVFQSTSLEKNPVLANLSPNGKIGKIVAASGTASSYYQYGPGVSLKGVVELAGEGPETGGTLYNEGIIQGGNGSTVVGFNKWRPNSNNVVGGWCGVQSDWQGMPNEGWLRQINEVNLFYYSNATPRYYWIRYPSDFYGTPSYYQVKYNCTDKNELSFVEDQYLDPNGYGVPKSPVTGGSVTIETGEIYQKGTISGGQGVSISFENAGDAPYWWNSYRFGGRGGNVTIGGTGPNNLKGQRIVAGQGSITSAGKGGDVKVTKVECHGCGVEIRGGKGGDLKIYTAEVRLEGDVNLTGNSIYVDPTVMMGGKGIHITAEEDVFIYGGDNWELNLNNLSENAITAGRKIVLAVGPGGKVNLTGNAANIFKAAEKVEIYADNVVLDPGVTLEDLVSEVDGKKPEIVKAGNKIIYHATLSGTSQVTDKAGTTVPVSLTLHNVGPKVDTYTLSATSQNGWTVSDLPATVTVEGLKQTELNFNVTLPAEGNDVITVTATSQADSTVVATTQIQAAVEKPVVVEPEKVALTLTKAGEGALTAQGIDCGTDCTEDYVLNTEVKLTATPANGYQFANWSGDCASDTVTMDKAKNCVANFTMQRYTTSGKVLAETNMPLPGATVKIGDNTTTTDAHGNWQIDGLTNGNYTATVTKNGYTIPTQNVVVNGENLTFDLGVVYSVYGTIKDEQKQPVGLVTITIGDQHTQTDAIGNWKLDGLPAGESTLIASKDGYKFAPVKFVLGDQEPNKELLVTPASTLVMTAKPSPWQAIRQGANVTYTYTLFNGGVSTATGVTFTETVPNGAKLVTLTPKNGGECDAQTLTCTLPDLTAGATAQVELVLQATDGNSLKNTATVTANEYPADVQTTYKAVKPHLSVTVTDSHDPVVMLTDLHYTATVELSPLAPETTAKDINLVMQLPKGLELKAVTPAAGTCDSSQFPLISCQLPNLSIASPVPLLDKEGLGVVSQTAVNVDVTLKDAGLLVLSNEAKVTASNYPAHTVREKTNIFIPDTIKIDMVLVIDTTNSMQPEINGVYAALNQLIKEIPAGQRPTMALIEFKDDVRVKAFTQDTDVMLGAVAKLVAEGGGTCPEASAEALEVALKHLKDGGTIFLATDASPYPEANLENLAALIKSKNMKFNALITGDCSSEGDWNGMTK